VHGGQHLDRDRPAEYLVTAAPYLAHAAGSDPLDQLIAVVENVVGRH